MTQAPAADRTLAAVLLAVVAAAGWCWGGAALAATLTGTQPPALADAVTALVALPAHLDDPADAWPPPSHPPVGAIGYWASQTAVTAAIAAVAVPVAMRWRRGRGRHPLGVPPGRLGQPPPRHLLLPAPTAGRLTLGRRGRRLVAAEAQASLCVVGPTGCGKTAGLAIPALLEWDGPVLAASVKTDLLAHTLGHRRNLGETWIYDPSGAAGAGTDSWTLLATSRTWADAQRTAALLCDAARAGDQGVTDADYWYTQARKALAPHLYAAAIDDRSIGNVLQWVDSEEQAAIGELLKSAEPDRQAARRALLALWNKEDRVRSSVYATVENVLLAYADPGVQAAATTTTAQRSIRFDRWLTGNNTLYLVAPTHEQTRLRPVLTALAQTAIRAAYDTANRNGGALVRPCLILLDEAGNTAPLPDLPAYAATARSHGITLVDIWQDLAQIEAIYGDRSRTVVNNHRALLFGRGIADADTLTLISQLVGDAPEQRWQHSHDLAGGRRSIAEHTTFRPQAPVDVLRRLPENRAIVVYGAEAAFDLALRPWYQNASRRAMSQTSD